MMSFLNLFILFLTVLGFHCCARAFFGFGKQGPLSGCGEQASHYGGFSCWGAGALGHAGFSTCSTCAQLHQGTWNLLEPGIEPVSPA